jgi:hypothetical protein
MGHAEQHVSAVSSLIGVLLGCIEHKPGSCCEALPVEGTLGHRPNLLVDSGNWHSAAANAGLGTMLCYPIWNGAVLFVNSVAINVIFGDWQ